MTGKADNPGPAGRDSDLSEALFVGADDPFGGRPPPRPLAKLMRRYPGAFATPGAAARFVRQIWFPPSRAWRYQLNGKSGNTFTLHLLFELEYATPFTSGVDPSVTGNQHPDFALFQVSDAGLLSNAVAQGDSYRAFRDFPGLSIATVRNPYDRAVSGFFYLCRSHRLGDRRFLTERLRLNALAGFDWDRHGETQEGFARFLHYVRACAASLGAERLDAHWLPQALHIRPDIYRPDLIGRTEALDVFARELAQRLDRPLLRDPDEMRRNARHRSGAEDFYADPALRRLVEEIYAEDFDLFEYARR